MPVTLESRIRQMQVFNLAHQHCCHREACACTDVAMVVLEENPRTGERAPRYMTLKAPASLTLLARERRAGLASAVLEAPEVRAAIARGHVRVVEQTPEVSSAQPAAPTPPSAPSSPASAATAAATVSTRKEG